MKKDSKKKGYVNLMEIEFNQILSFNKSFNKSEKVSYVF